MNFRFTVVETSLNRAEFRWKGLRLLQHTAVLGLGICLLVAAFGLLVLEGWITSEPVGVAFFVGLGTLGFVSWAVVLIGVMAGSPDRNWLAAAVEKIDRRLLDRLNTLLFLEGQRGDARTESFARHIARQTQGVLAEKPSPAPFSAKRPLFSLFVFLAALSGTVLLYQVYAPWNVLLAADKVRKDRHAAPEKPLELALPTINSVEQKGPWGEIRITDPGVDLRVTKVDVVPLQIEAAANQPLTEIGWSSTINGAPEAGHPLPPPSDPHYAVYQPTIFLDELQLSDWDVMTYYARASTQKTNSFASEVYFVEVRPFREDILKMPGGPNGKAYQALNELSGLINRQQHIVRQTHQHVQNPPESVNLQGQERKKLADAEGDLSASTQHLYARLAADMENAPIGEALDNLAQAQKSLDDASNQLQKAVMDQAQNSERSALSQLVAARKMFHKAIADDPNSFQEPLDEDETTPVAEASKKLTQMAEFRNEAKAANDFVQKTLQQQKSLERQAREAPRAEYQRLGAQEQQLQKALEDFQNQHPEPFKGAGAQSQRSQQAMLHAADSLQLRRNDARAATQQATAELEKLSQAMQDQTAAQQLADAYKLKQMLDREIQTFDEISKPDGKVSEDDQERTVKEAQGTIDQLRKTAEQEPTRDAFGPRLRETLSGENKIDLDAKLKRMERPRRLDQAQDTSRQQRAGEARDALAKVSNAFEQSQPKSLQMARRTDWLKPSEQDSFGQGIAELGSLIKQLESNRPLSPQDQAKQCQQALANLQSGMRNQFGNNDRGNEILGQLERVLKGENSPDLGDLKKLLEKLQHFSVEITEQMARNEDQPEVSNIDPARLPPAYRGRIQKYFQKLSEK